MFQDDGVPIRDRKGPELRWDAVADYEVVRARVYSLYAHAHSNPIEHRGRRLVSVAQWLRQRHVREVIDK